MDRTPTLAPSPSELRQPEARLRSATLVFMALGPLSGLLCAGLAIWTGGAAAVAVAAGVLGLGLVWGFVGSLALMGAATLEKVERATERRETLRAARTRPEAGQLSIEASAGGLSRPPPDRAASASAQDHRPRGGSSGWPTRAPRA